MADLPENVKDEFKKKVSDLADQAEKEIHGMASDFAKIRGLESVAFFEYREFYDNLMMLFFQNILGARLARKRNETKLVSKTIKPSS